MKQFTNRLIKEKSPYLLQHSKNPVDWYPWGEEAFKKSKDLNKPIFLSIGYSTCHWCHVMERESFENEDVAKIMNECFVNVKVDREERPDVDKVYMNFVQSLTGSGGWPLSVWISPGLKPFYGGTYFPPVSNYGRPSFSNILTHISNLWKTKKEELVEESNQILEQLQKSTKKVSLKTPYETPDEILNHAKEEIMEEYDSNEGGFGTFPKFPRPVIYNFLFRISNLDDDLSKACLFTLDKMSQGGMYDHIGGGFHRYSTDKYWHIPHFEKMMYDQAQLISSYLDAYQITKKKIYSLKAKEILQYCLNEMRFENRVFFSAEDADSLQKPEDKYKLEGAFYVYTKQEIDEILKENSVKFCKLFGVKENGNVNPTSDPHGELKNQNVLYLKNNDSDSKDINEMKKLLFEFRSKRPRPHLDDKILTCWNGMMISALSKASQVFNSDTYLKDALKVANFIKTELFKDGILYRVYREGLSPIEGFLSDYSFLVKGLLDLYETSADLNWLNWAMDLQDQQIKLFYDEKEGAFFDTNGKDKSILIQSKDYYDGAEPSANSIALMNLIRCHAILKDEKYLKLYKQSIQYFDIYMRKAPTAVPEMLCSFKQYSKPGKTIIILYSSDTDFNDSLNEYLKIIHSKYMPDKSIIFWNKKNSKVDQFWMDKLDFMKDAKLIDDKPTIFVCENFSCQLPVNCVEELQKIL
eukprot:gene2414-2878_t